MDTEHSRDTTGAKEVTETHANEDSKTNYYYDDDFTNIIDDKQDYNIPFLPDYTYLLDGKHIYNNSYSNL